MPTVRVEVEKTAEQKQELVALPTEEEFARMLEQDEPVAPTTTQANYAVYHRYSRSC